MDKAESNRAEEIAFREAFNAFFKELTKSLGEDRIAELNNTSHQHCTLMSDGNKVVVCTTSISFSDNEASIKKAIKDLEARYGRPA